MVFLLIKNLKACCTVSTLNAIYVSGTPSDCGLKQLSQSTDLSSLSDKKLAHKNVIYCKPIKSPTIDSRLRY
jgi:hypothetical protein